MTPIKSIKLNSTVYTAGDEIESINAKVGDVLFAYSGVLHSDVNLIKVLGLVGVNKQPTDILVDGGSMVARNLVDTNGCVWYYLKMNKLYQRIDDEYTALVQAIV